MSHGLSSQFTGVQAVWSSFVRARVRERESCSSQSFQFVHVFLVLLLHRFSSMFTCVMGRVKTKDEPKMQANQWLRI